MAATQNYEDNITPKVKVQQSKLSGFNLNQMFDR